MASAVLRQELVCPICLSIYTDPVTLTCGHNFCQECIAGALDEQEGSGVYTCPVCRAIYNERPEPQINTTLKTIVIAETSPQPDQTKSGIFCTYCVDSPVPAAKSCLHCEASLCDKHLRVHSKSPEHVLCDPTTALGTRKCSVHKELFRYYCTEDAACICMSCSTVGDHTGHLMESLDVASEKKKEKLRDVLQKLTTMREETEESDHSLQKRGEEFHKKTADVREIVSALLRDIRRQLEDLEKRVWREISRQEEFFSFSVSDEIQQLEIKKDELSRKMRHIEELCNMSDPVTVLQEPDLDTADLCDAENSVQYIMRVGNLNVRDISGTLGTLSDVVRQINNLMLNDTNSSAKEVTPKTLKVWDPEDRLREPMD